MTHFGVAGVTGGPTVAVVDYGRGNLFSLARALETVGAEPRVTDRPEALLDADAVVLPGVGAFRDAMDGLTRRGHDAALRQIAARGVPLLGICLGMQLLFERSEEFGTCAGLGLIAGEVRRLPAYRPGVVPGDDCVRIPNVGWRRLIRHGACPVLDRVSDGAMFYFVHSFVPVPARTEAIAGTLDVNGSQAAVLVQWGSIYGCQFHPEKSGPEGLALLRGFADLALARASARWDVA